MNFDIIGWFLIGVLFVDIVSVDIVFLVVLSVVYVKFCLWSWIKKFSIVVIDGLLGEVCCLL